MNIKEMFRGEKFLSLVLWLVALHSFCVGIGLILMPSAWITYFGFREIHEPFFRVQGGVFHIVMCVAYVYAARRLKQCVYLVDFSIIAKFMATVFLFSYYLFAAGAWMILASGVGDLLMAIVLLYLSRPLRRPRHE